MTPTIIRPPLVVRWLKHIPILGWMLREVGQNPHQALPLFALNMALLMILSIWTFGVIAAAVYAFIAAPLMFVFLLIVGSN